AGLDQCGRTGTVHIPVRGVYSGEGVQACERAGGGDFEDRAGACGPTRVGSIEVTIGALDKPDRGEGPIGRLERVLASERAARGDLEDRAASIGPAKVGGSV